MTFSGKFELRFMIDSPRRSVREYFFLLEKLFGRRILSIDFFIIGEKYVAVTHGPESIISSLFMIELSFLLLKHILPLIRVDDVFGVFEQIRLNPGHGVG